MPEYAELLKGHARFKAGPYPRQRERFDALVKEGQHPKLMIIGCSDSRVDPAQIFDVDPGEIFVIRNVAALVPPREETPGVHGVSAAVEYAVQVLEVRQIVVMGHGMCGGCKAALSREMAGRDPGAGGYIQRWISLLDAARDEVVRTFGSSGRDAERAMECAAVRVSLANLRSFPWLAAREAEGLLKLRGAFFAISEGVLYSLDEQTGGFVPVE